MPGNSETLPFFIRKYLINNSSLFVKIKLAKCSKNYGQITRKSWNGEYSFSTIKIYKAHVFTNKHENSGYLGPTYLYQQKFFIIKKSLIMHSVGATKIMSILPKRDICNLLFLRLINVNMSYTDFEKLLVPSLQSIYLKNLQMYSSADLVLLILIRLPDIREIYAPWDFAPSSFHSLIAINREQKLSSLHLTDLRENIHKKVVEKFGAKHMKSGSWITLQSNYGTFCYEHK